MYTVSQSDFVIGSQVVCKTKVAAYVFELQRPFWVKFCLSGKNDTIIVLLKTPFNPSVVGYVLYSLRN